LLGLWGGCVAIVEGCIGFRGRCHYRFRGTIVHLWLRRGIHRWCMLLYVDRWSCLLLRCWCLGGILASGCIGILPAYSPLNLGRLLLGCLLGRILIVRLIPLFWDRKSWACYGRSPVVLLVLLLRSPIGGVGRLWSTIGLLLAVASIETLGSASRSRYITRNRWIHCRDWSLLRKVITTNGVLAICI
jgi:hypothetical protein